MSATALAGQSPQVDQPVEALHLIGRGRLVDQRHFQQQLLSQLAFRLVIQEAHRDQQVSQLLIAQRSAQADQHKNLHREILQRIQATLRPLTQATQQVL